MFQASLFAALNNLAQTTLKEEGKTEVDIPVISAVDVAVGALNITYFAAGIVAVISILLAAITYVTANGDANSIAKAKNTILYSVVGLIVVISAAAITNFVTGEFL